ncbi:DUF4097 family beta strand repeat-containing protein [Paenibacillus sp. FSL K6-1230]|uniref:DUF4097 family beta strand repeat-containing protein n=1 Tax=Paenibacillus sp. FSL K6-1230 TaxID=2921603 RepID=UPI00146D1BF7|nr:DUF4097 family beta strand repeat-containing protein [Paenibacillus massiliensis]
MNSKIRVGRYTSSLLLLVVGVLLLLDQMNGTEHMMLLLKWWPLIFVSWGLEYLIMLVSVTRNGRKPHRMRRFRPDLKGLMLAIILSASVFIVTEQHHYMHLWNRVSINLTTASMDFSEEADNRLSKGSVLLPLSMDTESLLVESVNGNIRLIRGPVSHVEVHSTVWVDQVSSVEAAAIAEASSIDISNGTSIQVHTQGQAYGQSGKRQPLINLTIVIPENRRLNMDIRTSNGNITVDRVDAIDRMNLQTGNGQLIVQDAIGDVNGTTLNGNVDVHRVDGNVDMKTNRGSMLAGDISGLVSYSTQVGDIQIARTNGKVTADTKNGNIIINSAVWNVNANSLNGSVSIRTDRIGGDWNVYSAVGDIVLYLPPDGNFTLEGSSSYGRLSTDFPFSIEGKSITGVVGLGAYSVKVEGNSDLTVNQTELPPPVEEPDTETTDQGETDEVDSDQEGPAASTNSEAFGESNTEDTNAGEAIGDPAEG